MTETAFHEECGMPLEMHSVVCPGAPGVITPEALRKGPQPTTLEEWVGQGISAASTIDYGPGYNEQFDSESAANILQWMVEGIRNLEMSSK